MISSQLVFSKYLLHSSKKSYHFLQRNPLNCGKVITVKHVLHIYYLTNVDYTEKVYA